MGGQQAAAASSPHLWQVVLEADVADERRLPPQAAGARRDFEVPLRPPLLLLHRWACLGGCESRQGGPGGRSRRRAAERDTPARAPCRRPPSDGLPACCRRSPHSLTNQCHLLCQCRIDRDCVGAYWPRTRLNLMRLHPMGVSAQPAPPACPNEAVFRGRKPTTSAAVPRLLGGALRAQNISNPPNCP